MTSKTDVSSHSEDPRKRILKFRMTSESACIFARVSCDAATERVKRPHSEETEGYLAGLVKDLADIRWMIAGGSILQFASDSDRNQTAFRLLPRVKRDQTGARQQKLILNLAIHFSQHHIS